MKYKAVLGLLKKYSYSRARNTSEGGTESSWGSDASPVGPDICIAAEVAASSKWSAKSYSTSPFVTCCPALW